MEITVGRALALWGTVDGGGAVGAKGVATLAAESGGTELAVAVVLATLGVAVLERGAGVPTGGWGDAMGVAVAMLVFVFVFV